MFIGLFDECREGQIPRRLLRITSYMLHSLLRGIWFYDCFELMGLKNINIIERKII